MSLKLLVPGLAILLWSAAVTAQTQTSAPAPKTIDVTGHGEVAVAPDTMTVSFAVETQAQAADECTRLHAEKTRNVVDALKTKLPADAKIETSGYALNQTFAYGQTSALPPISQAPKRLWDFKIDITAYSPTIDNLGELLDAGLAAGATDIAGSGLQYLPEEESETGSNATGGEVGSSLGRRVGRPPRQMPAVSLDIETQGSSADEAVRRGWKIADQVERALRAKLQGQGEVKVLQFGITRSNSTATAPRYLPQPQPEPQRAYSAQTTVTAETHDLEKLGPLIEAGMKAGAARLNQVSFTVREDSDARKQAIEKASNDAKAKAQALAGSMGVKLKEVIRISTNAVVHPQIVYGQSLHAESFSAAQAGPRAEAMPVLPHQVGYSADVNVTYRIE